MNKKTMTIAIAVLVALLLVVGIMVLNFANMSKTDDLQATDVQTAPVETETAGDAAAQTEENAETVVEIFELSGEVTEVTDAYFVLEDKVHDQVQVNFSDDTIFEGVEMSEIAVGQYVLVMYDGKLTRSLPAQAYALKVGVYEISGKVIEAVDGSVTIAREELGDEVIVHLPEGMTAPAVGSEVIAYTTGAMTMSLPAQTTAIGVVTK